MIIFIFYNIIYNNMYTPAPIGAIYIGYTLVTIYPNIDILNNTYIYTPITKYTQSSRDILIVIYTYIYVIYAIILYTLYIYIVYSI